MSKQKYQLPQRTIGTIKEEIQMTPDTPINLSPSNPSTDSMEKTDFRSMMESFISEETIVISDPQPFADSIRSSPKEISDQSQDASSYVVNSETYQQSNHHASARSALSPQHESNHHSSTRSKISSRQQESDHHVSTRSELSRQQVAPQTPSSTGNKHSALSHIPEENNKMDGINYNGFSEFPEVIFHVK